MGKGLLKSKLSWLGILTAIAGIADQLSGNEMIANNPQVVGILTIVGGVAVTLLRVFGTSEPITSIK